MAGSSQAVSWYAERQNHNLITRWLHSFRYRYALEAFKQVAGDKPKVVDIGCGSGKLYDVLREVRPLEYTGIEIEPNFAQLAREQHVDAPGFTIIEESALTAIERCDADIVMALETFEHIPENEVVRLVEIIAAKRPKLLFVSVPVEIGPAIWLKNVGSAACGYVRHRDYQWSETFWAGLYQLDRLPPHGTLHKGFDWRWLAQVVRQNVQKNGMTMHTHRFPLSFMPAAVSASVCFVATH